MTARSNDTSTRPPLTSVTSDFLSAGLAPGLSILAFVEERTWRAPMTEDVLAPFPAQHHERPRSATTPDTGVKRKTSLQLGEFSRLGGSQEEESDLRNLTFPTDAGTRS